MCVCCVCGLVVWKVLAGTRVSFSVFVAPWMNMQHSNQFHVATVRVSLCAFLEKQMVYKGCKPAGDIKLYVSAN